jgi:hypothetical protein
MFTRMTIFNCPKYLCLRICSVDDTKVDIDWMRTKSENLLQPQTNEHRTKTEQSKTPYRDGKSK